jgi:cysteine desulfurase
MLPYLTEHFGNPSGSHAVARRALAAVDEAREKVAFHLGCRPGEVVFTSGGTEACNLAVLGAYRAGGGAVLCSAFEHHAVLEACAACGGEVVAVTPEGSVDLDALAGLLGPAVGIVSLMLANNEVGTVQPLVEALEWVRRQAPRALFHTDAVGAGAWLDLADATAGADLVSVGARQFGGPKGVGVLVVRSGTALARILHGGPQERERRPGTQNVAAIVGMAAALDAASSARASEVAAISALRQRLARGVVDSVPGTHETAAGAPRLPGTCHLRFEGVDQEELLLLLDEAGVCASAGSACASGALAASHVLAAMGFSIEQSRQAVRLSLGWSTTEQDVERALEAVPKAVEQLRGMGGDGRGGRGVGGDGRGGRPGGGDGRGGRPGGAGRNGRTGRTGGR